MSASHTQPFYGSLGFVWDKPGEPVQGETFTHSYLSWSSVVPYLLHPSNTIHGILPVQFTCLRVFFSNLSKFSLVYLLAWHPPLHPSSFTQSLSSFHSTCPCHCNLFCCSAEIMSSNLSLSTLYVELLSCSFMPHIHLTTLICAC